MSGDDNEAVAWQVVSDVMSEGCDAAIVDGRHIDAATEELVDEGAIVIGTHGGAGTEANLMIERLLPHRTFATVAIMLCFLSSVGELASKGHCS